MMLVIPQLNFLRLNRTSFVTASPVCVRGGLHSMEPNQALHGRRECVSFPVCVFPFSFFLSFPACRLSAAAGLYVRATTL